MVRYTPNKELYTEEVADAAEKKKSYGCLLREDREPQADKKNLQVLRERKTEPK